jgi:ATP synthase protein I
VNSNQLIQIKERPGATSTLPFDNGTERSGSTILSDEQHHPGRPRESHRRPTAASSSSALARGLQLSTELVAAVLVGAAIGWLTDRWLRISPWGMIVFLLLGFAAGVLNVMRAAGIPPRKRLDELDRNDEG